MPVRKLQRTQVLAVTALLSYTGYFFVSQPSFTAADGKLTAMLSWSHSGGPGSSDRILSSMSGKIC